MLDKNKMRGKKMNSKKILTFVLAMVMFIGCLPLNPIATYAAEGDVAIDETNFPDSNFRNYVNENFDADNNGFLSQSECDNVEKINISQSFDAEDNSIKVKSLKGIEYFKNLKKLNCELNQLTSLDVSENTALTNLNCDFNQLTSLDVSGHTALRKLYCEGNQLTSLDVSGDTALKDLECYNNQLTSLDVGDNPALENLDCYNNKLKSLNVSGDKALKYLECNNNQLTSLDVGDNPALENLECNNNQLTSLDTSKNTALELLTCNNNQLTSLDTSKNTALGTLYCNNNQLTSLDTSKNTTLRALFCNDNQLTSLDVSKNTVLKGLECNNNQLTSLDASKNPVLETLSCNDNQLTSLDVSGDTNLNYLNCKYNQLTSLDVSNNPSLWMFLGCNNPLVSVKSYNIPFEKQLSPITYTVKVAEGSSKIPFTALPQGFDKKRIKANSVEGASLEEDGFNWDKLTNPIQFKYKLWDKPETNDAELREADDEESGFEYAKLSVAILEIVGPVDPTKPEGKNPDESKYWTVKFESEDTSKGTVAAENTFYVLKTAGKTLADLKDKAPVTASKAGYEFDKWDPALDKSTAIDKDITVKAYFKKANQPTPAPKPNPSIEYKRDNTPSIPVIVNVAKTMKLNVKLIIGSKEMIKSVDGVEEKIMMDVAPFIEKDRTMLPIRYVAEALGFNVRWDKDSRTVILIDKENVVKIPVDTNKIIVNEKEYISDVKPVIKNDRTMLPIANIARALGLKDGKDIHWNENTKEVIITREIAK